MSGGQHALARPRPLRDYGSVLWRRKLYIFLAVIVGAAIAFAVGGYSKHPQYEATAGVLTSLPSATVDPTVVDTDIQILEGSSVHALAVKADPDADGVTGSQEGDSAEIQVQAQRPSASAAVAATNAFANAYVTYVVKLERAEALAPVKADQAEAANIQQQIAALTAQMATLPSGSAELQLDTAQRNTLLAQQGTLQGQIQQAQAQANSAAITPSVLTSATFATRTGTKTGEIIALGAGAGLAVGLALAYLFENLEDPIEDADKELGGPSGQLGVVIPTRWTRPPEPVRAAGLPEIRGVNDPPAEHRSVQGDG